MTRRFAAAIGLLALCACQAPVIDGEGIIAFTDATVIDGTGADARPHTTIIVEDGRILQVVEADAVAFGPSVEVIPAEGRWIVPGFIDTHAHLSGSRLRRGIFQALLDHGVTAARSPATATRVAVAVRDSVLSGQILGPTYRVAGALLDGPGSPYGFASIITSPEEARAEVRLQAEARVDYIKVYTLLPPEVVAAAIDEAHTLGLEVIGHLGKTTWYEAAELGIDALTHSAIAGLASGMVPAERRDDFGDFFIPNADFDAAQFSDWMQAVGSHSEQVRDLGRLIAARGIALDPNLVLMDAVLRGDDPSVYSALVPDGDLDALAPHPFSADWTAEERVLALQARALFFDAVRILHEEGALITAGTDLLNPWMTAGISFHRELELLAEAGLSNLDVLSAATMNGARAISLGQELGSIQNGKRADLVILSADPLDDIRNTREITAVYQRGVRVDSAGR